MDTDIIKKANDIWREDNLRREREKSYKLLLEYRKNKEAQ